MKLFSYKRLLFFFLSVIALIGSISFTLIQIHKLQNNSKLVSHTYQMINLLETLVLNVSEAESLGLGYIITNDPFFLEKLKSTEALIHDGLNKAFTLISDRHGQYKRLEILKELIDYRMAVLEQSIALKEKDELSPSDLISKFNLGRQYLERIKVTKDKMVNEEQSILFTKQEVLAESIMHTVYAIIVSLLVGLVWFLFQMFFILSYIKSQKKYERDLINLNENKNRFFSIISHDLRGPVNNILQLSELIKEEVSEEERGKLNDMIEVSIKKVYDLLNNLLEWSRVQMNLIKIMPQLLHPRDLAEENFILLDEVAKSKDIRFVNDVGTEDTVWADKEMIKTVLRNLISNSIKFTRKGGVITVTSERKDNITQISVKDNGIGMSRIEIGKLFRRDVKFSGKGTSGESGSGLGLQICKEFIEKNGGEISVESETNKGSTFKFSLLSNKPVN